MKFQCFIENQTSFFLTSKWEQNGELPSFTEHQVIPVHIQTRSRAAGSSASMAGAAHIEPTYNHRIPHRTSLHSICPTSSLILANLVNSRNAYHLLSGIRGDSLMTPLNQGVISLICGLDTDPDTVTEGSRGILPVRKKNSSS